MSNQPLAITANNISLSAATEKSVAQIVAPTNIRLKVTGFCIGFQGTSGTDAPVLVRLIRTTTAGTGTSATLVKGRPGTDETIQSTGTYNHTVEGTNGDVMYEDRVHPQSSKTVYFPLGQEIDMAGGTRLALKCNAPQAQTANATIWFEE
jgi:hypothetical protein